MASEGGDAGTPSHACEHLFHTDQGQAFKLERMPFYREIYDKPRSKLVLYSSRQVIKSTTVRNLLIGRTASKIGSSAIYAGPTFAQVKDFSRRKLSNAFDFNPALRRFMVGKDSVRDVFEKTFRNRSSITLRSVGGGVHGFERVRGIPANDIYGDEVQSFLPDGLPVLESCADSFDGREGRFSAFYCYVGTPLLHVATGKHGNRVSKVAEPPASPKSTFRLWRDEDGIARTNVRNTYPDSIQGHEWGYGGSGPAELALSILRQFLPEDEAWELHGAFKDDVLEPMPWEGGEIGHDQVRQWIASEKERCVCC